MSKLSVIGSVICLVGAAQAAEIALIPTSATGSYQLIAGNAIAVQPGTRIWFEVHVSDWDSDTDGSPLLKTLQARLSLDRLENEYTDSPLFYPKVTCSTDADCSTHFLGIGGDSNTNCQSFVHCNPGTKCCSPLYSDTSRADWLGAGGSWLHAADVFSGRVGFVTDQPVEDDGTPKYVATLVLDVPPDAFGEFNVLLVSPETFVQDEQGPCCNAIRGTMKPAKVFVNVKPVSNYALKSRYLTIDHPYSYGGARAYRVTLVSLLRPFREAPLPIHQPGAFANFEGQVRFIGPPQIALIENEEPFRSFVASQLDCEPYYGDWSELPIHVFGSEVMPDSVYRVEVLQPPCADPFDSSCVVQVLGQFQTGRWADVQPPFEVDVPGTQPDLPDVSAMVDRFRNANAAPSKAQALLSPNIPDPSGNFSFVDISLGVDAFRGVGYPFPGPEECP